MSIRTFPGPPAIPGDATLLVHDDRTRCRSAAHQARRLYPGPLGELIQRELTAYADFGYNLANDALIPRLAAEVLGRTTSDDMP